jgi:hypothetical protein
LLIEDDDPTAAGALFAALSAGRDRNADHGTVTLELPELGITLLNR